jgi:hypothetical protein
LFRTNDVRERVQTVCQQIADRLGIRRRVVFVTGGVPKQSVANRVRFQFLLPLNVVIQGRGLYERNLQGSSPT